MKTANKTKAEILSDVAIIGFTLIFVLPFIAVFAALTVWVPWTCFGIGATYFGFLPEVWRSPSLLDTFLLIWVMKALPSVVIPSRTTKKD